MTDFDKIALLDRYGFRFSTRTTFAEFAPQAERECFATISGKFAVWETDSDVDGWALVGDDPSELLDLTVDTLQSCEVPELV